MPSVTPDSGRLPYFTSHTSPSSPYNRTEDPPEFSPTLPGGHKLKLPIIGFSEEGAPLITAGTLASLLLSHPNLSQSSTTILDPKGDHACHSDTISRSYSASPVLSEAAGDMEYSSSSSIERMPDMKFQPQLDFCQHYDKIYILDCRFQFEFNGGHLPSARNITTFQQVIDLLLPSISSSLNVLIPLNEMTRNPDNVPIMQERVLLIFHCEFSQSRGPEYFARFRELERTLHDYPELCFPESYVLFGGYNAFYSIFANLCVGQGYIRMSDTRWTQECTVGLKQRKEEKRLGKVFPDLISFCIIIVSLLVLFPCILLLNIYPPIILLYNTFTIIPTSV
jgi:hypothetical protein